MGNVTARTNAPAPSPTQVQIPEETAVEAKPATSSQLSDPAIVETPSKPEINKQHAAQKKGEQHIAGSVRQRELQQKLGATKTRGSEFPPNADNKALGQIGVYRFKTEEQSITRYPNGVNMETFPSSVVSKHQLQPGKYPGGVKLESAGAGFKITTPPGGHATVHSDGRITVSDAKDKAVASMDKDGKFQVHTKQGEYSQSPDGSIKFSTKEKTYPADLHKPGPIDPADYEKYGIVADGKTLHFPNGTKYGPGGDIIDRVAIGKGTKGDLFTITAPREHKVVNQILGHERTQEGMSSVTGEPLYDYQPNQARIYASNGSFIVTADGKVSFAPG